MTRQQIIDKLRDIAERLTIAADEYECDASNVPELSIADDLFQGVLSTIEEGETEDESSCPECQRIHGRHYSGPCEHGGER